MFICLAKVYAQYAIKEDGGRLNKRRFLLRCFLMGCLLLFPAASVRAADAKKGDTVTDGTFNYILLKMAGKKNGKASVYGINKRIFNDEDQDKKNDSPKKLVVPPQIKYDNGYYDVTATGSSGKATLSGTSSDYQYYWGRAEKIKLPDSITVIGDNSFAKAEKLEKINIPKGVTAIGGEAFSGTSLKKIALPATVEYLGRAAFWKCEKLAKVTFHEGMETIGKWAFQQSGIKQAALPQGLLEIKQAAFSKCVSLKKASLPDSVEILGAGVFSGCEKLKKLTVDEGSLSFQAVSGMIYTADGKDLVDGGAASGKCRLSDGLETIRKCAFESNGKVTSIIMPDTVRAVKDGAFLGCKKLKKAVLGSHVSKLGESAFANCAALREIAIPEPVKRIEKNAFYRCTSLQEMTMGTEVTAIEAYAFSGCHVLSAAAISGSVSKIGTEAFYQNMSLKSLELGEGVKSIGKKAFAYCGLSSVSLPETVTSLKNAAFQGNKELEKMVIPASVTEISDNVFAFCPKLADLEVSEENEQYQSQDGMLLNKQGNRLIAWPSAEGDVKISEGITTVGSYALQNTEINSLVIPDTVLKIEEGAFSNCQELVWVQFEGNELLLPAGTKDKDGVSNALFYGCFVLQTVSAPEIDEEDELQAVFAERLKKHMEGNGTIAWLKPSG